MSPFLTVGHAVSVAVAGTTISVGNGTFPENVTFSSQSGTSGAGCNITLKSTNGSGTALINGVVSTLTTPATIQNVNIDNSAYITIDHMNISNQSVSRDPNGVGITINNSSGTAGLTHDVTISNDYIHELCFDGIYMWPNVGGNILISGNQVYKAGHDAAIHIDGNAGGAAGTGTTAIDNDLSQTQQRPQLLGGIYSACRAYVSGDDADWFRAFGSGHIIGKPGHGNYAHDIPHGTTANPIDANEAHTDCIQTYISGLQHTVFEANTCRQNDAAAHTSWNESTGEIDGNGCSGCVNDVIFRNNVYANFSQGINLETGWQNVRVLNNTFDHITQEAIIYNSAVDTGSDAVNNIFYDVGNNSDGVIACITSVLPTYTTNDTFQRSGSQGTYCHNCTCPSTSVTDPKFAAYGDGTGSGADYRLCTAAGVPVAGCTGLSGIATAGTDLTSFTQDKVGTNRPQGIHRSIGAYEELLGVTRPCARNTRGCGYRFFP